MSIGAWALHGSALVNMGVWELYGGAIVGATQVCSSVHGRMGAVYVALLSVGDAGHRTKTMCPEATLG